MKNAIFCLPAIAMTVLCACFGAFTAPVAVGVLAVLALLWGGGLLLCRRVIWGAFCGAGAGLLLMWQSTHGNGAAVLVLGTVLLLYYVFCVCAVYQKG